MNKTLVLSKKLATIDIQAKQNKALQGVTK
jgi:hypothetical protein